jgi:D-alanyl-D-alanine carboxypeptidase/D-alanyl-D-alanine-endopeptidase (penicillin-binding protein 4)
MSMLSTGVLPPAVSNRLQTSLVAVLISLFAAIPASAQEVPQTPPPALKSTLDKIIETDAFENSLWGIYVTDAATGRTLYSRNRQKSFIPASNVKLYVTATALSMLGPDYRYLTRLYAQNRPTSGGQLRGNLVVRGSGDPTIGKRFRPGDDRTALFREWRDSLAAAGIRHMRGDIIGDDDVFDDVPFGEGWSWQDLTWWYAAEISGLSFNDNAVDLTVTPRRPDMPATLSWKPFNTKYVEFTNQTRTVPASADYDESYDKKWGTNHFTVSSLLPVDDGDEEALSVTNPTRYFAFVFRESLVRGGFAGRGEAVDVDELSFKPDYASDSLRRIAGHRSPPLNRIVQVTNRRSQNFYAEQLLKTIAAEEPLQPDDPLYEDELEPGSSAMGWQAALPFLATTGIDTSRINLVDGSGLSRKNLVTPQMTAQLLRYMQSDAPGDSVRSAFYQSLAQPGIEGTLRNRFERGPAAATVRAKTGTLSHVSALSGYVEDQRGRPLVFSIMVNHHTTDADKVREAQDRIVNRLARYPN